MLHVFSLMQWIVDTAKHSPVARSGSLNSPTLPQRNSPLNSTPNKSSEDGARTSPPASSPQQPPNINQRSASVGHQPSFDADDPELLARRMNQILLETHRKRIESLDANSVRRANLVS